MKIIRPLIELLLLFIIGPIVLAYAGILWLFKPRAEPAMSSVTEEWIAEKVEPL